MPSATCHHRTSGFTLLEVLVATLILTLGAGGVASLQLQTQRMIRDSDRLTSATQLAVELAEHMRDQDPDAYLFSYQAGTNASDSMTSSVPGHWQQRLQRSLPQARATVCRDNSADPHRWDCDQQASGAVVIKIGWTDNAHETTPPRLVLVTGL